MVAEPGNLPRIGPDTALAERIDRLESLDAIRQLAARYALSLDMRDLDAHVNLFVDDIRVGKERSGRSELKHWLDGTLRNQFTGTSHHIGGHIIEFEHPDRACGIVYSKNEHETGAEWVLMQMMYWDHYERRAGDWFFRRRLPLYWYASDINSPPVGDRKMRWPGREPYEGGWHALWPSWREFWDNPPEALSAVAAPAPPDQFLATMRRNTPPPKLRVR